MQKIFTKILDFQLNHPVATLVTALLLTLVSILYTVRNLDFQTGQMDLIYPDNPLVKLSDEIKTTIDYDTFIVVIENRNTSRSLSFLHALAPILNKDTKHYSRVFYRINPAQFKPWSLLYLDRKGLLKLRQNLYEHETLIRTLAASPGLTTLFDGINREIASSMMGELFTGFLDQPAAQDNKKASMDLTFVIRMLTEIKQHLDNDKPYVSPWKSVFTQDAWNENSQDTGYFWTKGKRYLLLFVTPKSTDSSFSDKLDALKRLRANISQLQKTSYRDIQAGVTGQEALNQDEMSTAFRDISIATVISLMGLAALLIVFWRGIRYPLLEITELIVALSWTFGLTTFFIGHLNILSITFAPLLLGLGIDYGIHWLARYQEEKQQMGLSRQEALRATMLRLGPSILLAGLTAAFSFFPLILTGFKGLVELGEIASMGMVMTTVSTLCLLPSLITLFDPRRPASAASIDRRPKSLFRITNRAAVPILLVCVLGFGFSLERAGRITFDLNMLHLQSKGAESVTWEHKLLHGSDQSSMYGVVLADSLENIRKKTDALTALSTVSDVQSVLSMLPENQKEKMKILQKMTPLLDETAMNAQDDPVNIADLNAVLGRIRFKMTDTKEVSKHLAAQMGEVRDLIDGLQERFRTLSNAHLTRSLGTLQDQFNKDLQDKLETLRLNVNAQPMQPGDLPLSLRERYILPDGRYMIRIFPSGDIWDPTVLSRFVADLRSVDSKAIGDPVTLDIFTRAFRDGCIKAAVFAVVFIIGLLLLTFRNLYQAFLVMTPLIMGTVWTLGLMDIFGVGFNLANSLFLPLIVGAGVEYGIIILQRRRQDGVSKDGTAIPLSTAKGVILAGLTTAVGFGSLTIAHHQGIASLGLLAMIGSLSILIAAVIFLPALMQVTDAVFAGRKAALRGSPQPCLEQNSSDDQGFKTRN